MAVSGMQLVFHGGLCCGIKTIYCMDYGPKAPDELQPALKKIERDDRDQNGSPVTSDTRFFHEEAPKESGRARLERYISYMKRRRPCNIVEVCIATTTYIWSDQTAWIPILKELGFKRVNHHINSNSGNTVHVFHLNIDEDYPGKDEGEPCDDEEDDYDDED